MQFKILQPQILVLNIFRLLKYPFYDFDLYEKVFSQSVEKIWNAIRIAFAFIIAELEYNYSVPGVFKNVIDFIFKHRTKPFDKKAMGIIKPFRVC